ncbi:MAG: hypothetical protein JJU29_24020 [Verrucomicrobia bacterium]|nr:hypothetical protein [Verrucomicrobiota bacterium]
MKIRNLAETGIKLLGIFSVFQFLSTLPTAIAVTQSRNYYQNVTGEYIDEMALGYFSRLVLSTNATCFFYLLMAVIFMVGASKIANWLVQSDEQELVQITGESVSRFVLQLAGIYALITWTPNFVQTLVQTIIFGSWQNPQVPILQRFYDNWSLLLSPAVGTLLGIFLLFRVNGMLRIIQLARPMTKEADEIKERD